MKISWARTATVLEGCWKKKCGRLPPPENRCFWMNFVGRMMLWEKWAWLHQSLESTVASSCAIVLLFTFRTFGKALREPCRLKDAQTLEPRSVSQWPRTRKVPRLKRTKWNEDYCNNYCNMRILPFFKHSHRSSQNLHMINGDHVTRRVGPLQNGQVPMLFVPCRSFRLRTTRAPAGGGWHACVPPWRPRQMFLRMQETGWGFF